MSLQPLTVVLCYAKQLLKRCVFIVVFVFVHGFERDPKLKIISSQRIKSVAAPVRGGGSSCPQDYRVKGSELSHPLDPHGNNGLMKPTHTVVETMMWALSMRETNHLSIIYIYIYIDLLNKYDIVVGPGLHIYVSALGVVCFFSHFFVFNKGSYTYFYQSMLLIYIFFKIRNVIVILLLLL